jgi:hypothetical protein
VSTTVNLRQLTPTQRATEAARRASDILDIQDTKIVAAALAEEALSLLQRDTTFAAHVRERCAGMVSQRRIVEPRERRRSPSRVELVPIKALGPREVNPAAPPDPYFLLELYGPDQLRLALSRYKLAELKQAAAVVQGRNPGTRPADKSRRDPLLDYIVEQVTRG